MSRQLHFLSAEFGESESWLLRVVNVMLCIAWT